MQSTSNNEYKNICILLTVVLVSFMCCIDASVVNIALPIMSQKLSESISSIQWVVTSYIMAISSTIIIFGRLGDIKGKSKIFKLGLIVFISGSLLCGFSHSFTSLLIFRILQGIGASATMANSQGIITHIYPSDGRGKALGILGSSVALGIMIGPPIGGFVIYILNWQCIFLINIPIGVLAYILALKFLPKNENNNERFDMKGAILFIAAILLLFSYLVLGQTMGYSKLLLIIILILSITCLAIFYILENKTKAPLLQVYIFKNSLYSLSIFCAFISFLCINAQNIIIPFYLQKTLKLSPSSAGLFMMVPPLILFLVSPISGSLSDKIGSELITLLGLILMSIGFFLMSLVTEHSSIIVVMIFISLISLGNGVFQPSNNFLIMSLVNKNMLGVVGSINSLVRNLGGIIGITLSTTLLHNRMSKKMGYNVVDYITRRDDAFVYGMRYVYNSLFILCVICTMLTIYRAYKSRIQ
jgi:EmrB/QacA subfamily drug resistance transporter